MIILFIDQAANHKNNCRIEHAQQMIAETRNRLLQYDQTEISDIYVNGIHHEKLLKIAEFIYRVENIRQIPHQSNKYIIQILNISEKHV